MMKKRIPAIILMFAMFLTTSYAANAYRKTITVTAGASVEFNNDAVPMTDANGKPVEVFIYNGTTYVPIRAVSNLFGADISYDRSTQTISVYDDFSEACGVAHEMSRILSSYYEVLLMEFVSVADGGTPVSMYDAVAKIDMRKADMEDAFAYMRTDAGDNCNMPILENSINYYRTAANSCSYVAQVYEDYVLTPNSANAAAFKKEFFAMSEKYNRAQEAISQMFDKYCLWRDLGF